MLFIISSQSSPPYFNCSLPEECETCNSCNFLRLGFYFKLIILYYIPFVQQNSTENALAAQALHYSHGLHLQHQKLFLQVYYKFKQKMSPWKVVLAD